MINHKVSQVQSGGIFENQNRTEKFYISVNIWPRFRLYHSPLH